MRNLFIRFILSTSFIFFLYLIVSSLLLVFPVNAQEQSQEIIEKYSNAVCNFECTACLKVIPLDDEAVYEACKTKTYEGINLCRQKCLATKDKKLLQAAQKMIQSCKNCMATKQCPNKRGKYCQAVDSGRDLVEFIQNAIKSGSDELESPSFGCPAGANLVGNKCQCVDSQAQLDSLHTVCLNKEKIKDKIKLTLLLLPDDLQKAIYATAKQMMKEKANKELLFGFIVAATKTDLDKIDIDENTLSEFIFSEVISDTNKLHELIKKAIEQLKNIKQSLVTPIASPSDIEESINPNMSTDEFIAFERKVDSKIVEYCKSINIYKDCHAKCSCPTCYDWADCQFECEAKAGCGMCRTDSDCKLYGERAGYKAYCYFSVRSSKNGYCSLVNPIQPL